MSQAFNTRLLHALSTSAGTELSLNYCNSLAEQKERADRAGNQLIVDAIERNGANGERLNYRISELTEAMGRRDREIASGIEHLGREQELTNELLEEMTSSIISGFGELTQNMRDGLVAVEQSVREEGASTREHMSRLNAENRECRRLDSCYTYRAVKLLVQEMTAKALFEMLAEHQAIGEQVGEIWSGVFRRYVDEFNLLADVAEDSALASAQKRAAQVESELQSIVSRQDQVRPMADAPIKGFFGRGRQKELKADAAARLYELQTHEARLRQELQGLRPDFVLRASCSEGERRPLVEQARRKTKDAFLATPLGQAMFDARGTPLMRMPSFKLTIPQVDFDVSRAIEDAGSGEYPGIGRIPSKQETLQRVHYLSQVADELSGIDIDELQNPADPCDLASLRAFLFTPIDQIADETLFRSRRDYERVGAITENEKWIRDQHVWDKEGWKSDDEILQAAKALAAELGGKINVSRLQRHFRLSYNAAKSLLESVEASP